MFARINRKAEQREKDKCTCDQRPAVYLDAHSRLGDILPNRTWDLLDHGIVAVRVGPTLPRYDTRRCIGHDKKCRQWDGGKYLNRGDGYQA